MSSDAENKPSIAHTIMQQAPYLGIRENSDDEDGNKERGEHTANVSGSNNVDINEATNFFLDLDPDFFLLCRLLIFFVQVIDVDVTRRNSEPSL